MRETAPDVCSLVGGTPLVRVGKLGSGDNEVYAKLEGDNPAGSVKDRPALAMIEGAERRGEINKGDLLIEGTSGNTGIALAMVAAAKGYRMRLVMPENQTEERKAAMRAYGAELVLVSAEEGMEGARDLAQRMMDDGDGRVLDQFANPDNPDCHVRTTGPEIWEGTDGRITHFVSSMGTTGTITGCGRYFRDKAPGKVRVVGCQPKEGARIPGIRKWPEEYVPKIMDDSVIDETILIGQEEAETTMRRLAREEGIFCGVSSGGAMWAALEVDRREKGAVIVSIACDRGDRYLNSGVFNPEGE